MPEKPKKGTECGGAKNVEPDDPTWEADQKRREYYYDDAHGYEKYEPDEEDEIEEA